MGARTDRRPPLRYRLLSAVAAPLLRAWVARLARRLRADPTVPADERRRFVRERLGRADGPPGTGQDAAPDADAAEPGGRVWLHCASVGETITALPLIRALAARDGRGPLVTTATPTGARVLAGRGPANVRHRYLPIDRPGPVARFLDAERPCAGGIVETEIWPWLFALAKARGVPLTILSGRLSARTLGGAARLLAPVYRDALDGVRVLARSDADAARFRALGGGGATVETVGDLKDAGGTDAPVPEPLLPRRYALAASTHADEEARLARAWVRAAADAVRDGAGDGDGAPLLVVAPRHPERGDEVHAALAGAAPAGTGVARRSRGEVAAGTDLLYLADTLGELDAWYVHAAAAFVGGSLVERGGHNLMEPARVGTPVVTGPHASNFTDALASLLEADAVVVASDADEAVATLLAGLGGDEDVRARGERGRRVATARARGTLGPYVAVFADRKAGTSGRKKDGRNGST